MQTLAIRLRVMHLSAEMAAMRKWLDEHSCPRIFGAQADLPIAICD